MLSNENSILQLMYKISNTKPTTNNGVAMTYSTGKYPALSSYFINAMHEGKTIGDLERNLHAKSTIVNKFMTDASEIYLTESFSLGEKETKNFFLSMIKNPEIRVIDLPSFFYLHFEDAINSVWEAAKDKFDADINKGDAHEDI